MHSVGLFDKTCMCLLKVTIRVNALLLQAKVLKEGVLALKQELRPVEGEILEYVVSRRRMEIQMNEKSHREITVYMSFSSPGSLLPTCQCFRSLSEWLHRYSSARIYL